MPRLRVDSSASASTSLNSMAIRSFSLRWTYIGSVPSRSHASDTPNTRQMSEMVRSLGFFTPEQRPEINATET